MSARRQINRPPRLKLVDPPSHSPAPTTGATPDAPPPVAWRRGALVAPAGGPYDESHLLVILGRQQGGHTERYAARFLFAERDARLSGVVYVDAREVVEAASMGVDTSAPRVQRAAARLARVYPDARDTYTPTPPSASSQAKALQAAYERVANRLARPTDNLE